MRPEARSRSRHASMHRTGLIERDVVVEVVGIGALGRAAALCATTGPRTARTRAAPPLGRELLSPPKSASPPPLPSRLPRSCMRSPTISVEYFSTPSLSVYLRVCSRPSI